MTVEGQRGSTGPHAQPPSAVLADLGVGDGGLSAAESRRRLHDFGPNKLPEPERDPLLKRVLKHFHDILIYILLAAAALKGIFAQWVDFGVILGVAVITALIGFFQEGRAEQALAGIRTMLSLRARAKRDGQWQEVPSEELVPGDIIKIKSGDRVPADARLLEAVNLRVEESALTGEAVPSDKRVEPVAPDAGVGDRHCMVFSGSLVASGQGVAVVTATGQHAEIGRIQSMLSEVEQLDTPLTRELRAFGKVLAAIILGMALLMVAIGRLVHDFEGLELVSATIGFAVAAIPEGLPALVTIILALGVQQMAGRNAIMRNLPAVETLGSVTTICSDKTGTLTRNEMTVRHVITDRGRYDVAGQGYEPVGEVVIDGSPADLRQHLDLRALVMVMDVANDSRVVEQEGQWRVLGEPTEGALRTLGKKVGFDPKVYRRLAAVPFESEHKYMAVLSVAPSGNRLVMLKGAPDRVLDKCADQQGADGRPRPLDRGFWERRIGELGREGLRVLAAAVKPAAADTESLDHGDLHRMTFLGVVGILDPPRPEAVSAIETCHRAGIDVKMITGDHAETAAAIAREMGLSRDPDAQTITGAELEAMSDEQLELVVERTETFARTSPEHKLRIVKALQACGHVVAMTGDGVNDAPALKRADIGVSMGIKGTEATKEAADMVLADDNFSTIERAVEEGRRIYDNLQKSLLFLLPTNGAQSLVILVAVLFGTELPLTPVQILWINMVTAITLAFALAYEPAEPDVMDRPPRNPGSPIVRQGFLARIGLVSILIAAATIGVYFWSRSMGQEAPEARTAAVTMLALGQAAYLFNARHLRESSLHRGLVTDNPAVWISILLFLALQLLFVYAPFMNAWFGSVPLGAPGWLVPLALSAVIFLLVEAAKAGSRHRLLWKESKLG